MGRKTVSRREFLRVSALAAGATVLAACVPTQAPVTGAAKEEEVSSSAPPAEGVEIRFASFDWFAMVPGIKWD